jgi:hypothetical protein
VASAQVKSCVLLAGLFAEGRTTVHEPMRTRDHTELALREFGADVDVDRLSITVMGRPRLKGRELRVPGDLSSAAFFLVAALIVPESSLTIHGVGLNPTRSALLDFLAEMGAQIKILDVTSSGGELIGDVLIRKSRIQGGVLEKARTAALIDEIPVLAVLGAASEEGLIVRDASELRVKETDRIATIAENFQRMGLRLSFSKTASKFPAAAVSRRGSGFVWRSPHRDGVLHCRARRRWPVHNSRRGRRLRVFPRIFRYTTASRRVNCNGCRRSNAGRFGSRSEQRVSDHRGKRGAAGRRS